MAGFVLIGGRSRRFGSDKARHVVSGVAASDRAASRLVEVCDSGVHLVGRREALWSTYPCFEDAVADIGPLGGVATALDVAESRYALIIATDLWNVTVGTLRVLLNELDRSANDIDLVCATTSSGRVQPLCGAWRVSTSRPALHRRIDQGKYAMVGIFEDLRSRLVEVSEIELANVNTPQDAIASQRVRPPSVSPGTTGSFEVGG